MNTLDYLDWRGDLTFAVSPFNEVDLFVCSQLSTPDYAGIVDYSPRCVPISKVSKKYFDTHVDDVSTLGVLQSAYVLPMLKALPLTKRFKRTRFCYALNRVNLENTEQFCAVTLELSDGTICLSFRGTDDTIIAWKEDFNLATKDYVPAQKDALDYLVDVAGHHDGKIRICGHSKGGNLAVYSAVKAPDFVKDRIIEVCSFDGPGFSDTFLAGDDYLCIKDRITTVLSQNSLVGTLLKPAGSIKYVTSSKFGPIAHDGFTWQVKGPSFIRSEGLGDASRTFGNAMNDTLDNMTVEEKQAFVDELFDTLLSTGAVTITDLKDFKISSAITMMKNFHDDKKVHSFTHKVGGEIFKSIYTPLLSKVPWQKDDDQNND